MHPPSSLGLRDGRRFRSREPALRIRHSTTCACRFLGPLARGSLRDAQVAGLLCQFSRQASPVRTRRHVSVPRCVESSGSTPGTIGGRGTAVGASSLAAAPGPRRSHAGSRPPACCRGALSSMRCKAQQPGRGMPSVQVQEQAQRHIAACHDVTPRPVPTAHRAFLLDSAMVLGVFSLASLSGSRGQGASRGR